MLLYVQKPFIAVNVVDARTLQVHSMPGPRRIDGVRRTVTRHDASGITFGQAPSR